MNRPALVVAIGAIGDPRREPLGTAVGVGVEPGLVM
jgi:hypothetical protein